MGLVHELHVVVIVSEVQGIVCKQLRKTVNEVYWWTAAVHRRPFQVPFAAVRSLLDIQLLPYPSRPYQSQSQSQSQFYLSISSHVLDIQRNRNYVSHYPMRLHRQQQQQQQQQ